MEQLDTTRLVWVSLIVLASMGAIVAVFRPPADDVPRETPAPTPRAESLQCLDGLTFRTLDEQVEPPAPGLPAARERWTLSFERGGYVLVRGARREAGAYRCDGAIVTADGSGGRHRAHWDAANARLAWDALGFECATGCDGTPAPATTGTGG